MPIVIVVVRFTPQSQNRVDGKRFAGVIIVVDVAVIVVDVGTNRRDGRNGRWRGTRTFRSIATAGRCRRICNRIES